MINYVISITGILLAALALFVGGVGGVIVAAFSIGMCVSSSLTQIFKDK